VFIHHKKGRHIYRLKPRFNETVNSYWMCDKGRYTYKDSNYDRRLTHAKLLGVDLPHDEAISMWAADLNVFTSTERMDEIGVYLTPNQTNEELSALLELFVNKFKITKFFAEDVEGLVKADSAVDNFLLRSDPYPNSKGFLETLKKFGVKLGSLSDMAQSIEKQRLMHLIFVVPEGQRQITQLTGVAEAIRPDHFVVVLTPNRFAQELFASSLSIPTLSHFEKTGTVVNHGGLAQKISSNFKMFKEAFSIESVMKQLADAQSSGRKKERTGS